MSKLYHADQPSLFPVDDIPQKKYLRSKDKIYRAQRAREWRAVNKERVAQNNKTYRKNNEERLIQYRKTHYVANKEQLSQKGREQYKSHQEERLQYAKVYRETHQEQMRAYREANREQKRLYHLASRYGMNVEEWNTFYQQQNGCCAICNKSLNGNKDTAVDHCHKTGAVRGLLCGKCNSGIGMLDDSPDVVFRAYQYLSHWSIAVQELE